MACFNTFLGCEASKVISGGHSQVNPAYIINNYLYYFIVILINIIGILHDRMLSYDKIHWKQLGRHGYQGRKLMKEASYSTKILSQKLLVSKKSNKFIISFYFSISFTSSINISFFLWLYSNPIFFIYWKVYNINSESIKSNLFLTNILWIHMEIS